MLRTRRPTRRTRSRVMRRRTSTMAQTKPATRTMPSGTPSRSVGRALLAARRARSLRDRTSSPSCRLTRSLRYAALLFVFSCVACLRRRLLSHEQPTTFKRTLTLARCSPTDRFFPPARDARRASSCLQGLPPPLDRQDVRQRYLEACAGSRRYAGTRGRTFEGLAVLRAGEGPALRRESLARQSCEAGG